MNQFDLAQDQGQNGQSEKKTRRTRKDQFDRNYTCGCGKSYLSYPALYTHLKQKHDGKPPEGTSLPGLQGKANSRGRPPKKEDGDQNNKDDDKSIDSNEAVDVLEEILNFLDTIDKNYRRDKNDEWNEENKLSTIFPLEFFQGKDESDYKAILDGIKQLEDDPANYILEDIDLKEEVKKTEMNRIFVLFLNYIAKGVQNEALSEIMIFLCFYRKALNQYGWDAVEQKINNELSQQNQQNGQLNGDNPENNGMAIDTAPIHAQFQFEPAKKQQEYCQANNGDDSFLICNDLVIEVLPNYFRDYPNSNDLLIIGPTDEQLKNAVYIIQHFANWLFANRYTNTKLVIKADDE